MDERLESILNSVSDDDFTTVARGALGSTSATLTGSPVFSEITEAHYDLRTVGIVKVEGTARTSDGEMPWSSVVKVIDINADPGRFSYWVHPEQEELVYENHLFASDGLQFRPATCYLASNTVPSLNLIWLEDLTGADGAPFSVSQLFEIARNVGEFNGFHHGRPLNLPFEPATDRFYARWKDSPSHSMIGGLTELRDHKSTRTMYRNSAVEATMEIYSLMERLNERVKDHKRSLSFGDCQPGNLFRRDQDTVAIDWASLTLDPIGVDLGVLVGSSTRRGRNGPEVLLHEKQIYESYREGLASQGCNVPADDVRRAFFGQFGEFLTRTGVSPFWTATSREDIPKDISVENIEKHFETPWDEIPELLAGIVDHIPGYVEELNALLE